MDDRESPLGPGLAVGLVGSLTSEIGLKSLAMIAFIACFEPGIFYSIYFFATELPGALWTWFSQSVWAQLWYAICWIIGFWCPTVVLRVEKAFQDQNSDFFLKHCGYEMHANCEWGVEAQVEGGRLIS